MEVIEVNKMLFDFLKRLLALFYQLGAIDRREQINIWSHCA